MKKLILGAVATAMLTVTGASASESLLDKNLIKLSLGSGGYYSLESTHIDNRHHIMVDYSKFSDKTKQGRLILSNYDFSFIQGLAFVPTLDIVYNMYKTDESYFQDTTDPHVKKEVTNEKSKKKLRPGVGLKVIGISCFDTSVHLQNAQNYSLEIESKTNEVFAFENKFLNAINVGYKHVKIEDEVFNKFYVSYKF